MSKIYHDKKMFRESIDCCDKILRSDPKNIEILRIKNASLTEMGDDKAAYGCAEEIRNLQKDWWLDDDTEMASEKTKDAKIKELERESGKKQARIDELEEEKEKVGASYRSIASLTIIDIINPANKHAESDILEFKSSMRVAIDVITGKSLGNADVPAQVMLDEVSDAMGGFMNSKGGVLVIGYYDGDKPQKSATKRVVGLEKDYAVLGKNWDGWYLRFNTLFETEIGVKHKSCLQNVEHEMYNGELELVAGEGTLAKIVIKPSTEPVFVGKDKRFVIRQGNHTIRLDHEKTYEYIRSRFLKKGNP
jgi:hypothetical protein